MQDAADFNADSSVIAEKGVSFLVSGYNRAIHRQQIGAEVRPHIPMDFSLKFTKIGL